MTGAEVIQGRLATVISDMRLLEATATPRQLHKFRDVIDELSLIHRDVAGIDVALLGTGPALQLLEASEQVATRRGHAPGSRHNLTAQNASRHGAKEHDRQRHCPMHDEGAGAWLTVEAFDVKNKKTGALRSWCRDCTAAYQRQRYLSIEQARIVTEILEGDPCLGHACGGCGRPFEVGQRVVGHDLTHEGCVPASSDGDGAVGAGHKLERSPRRRSDVPEVLAS
jgi:hypothetical protein